LGLDILLIGLPDIACQKATDSQGKEPGQGVTSLRYG
jgi:hypothetical protein